MDVQTIVENQNWGSKTFPKHSNSRLCLIMTVNRKIWIALTSFLTITKSTDQTIDQKNNLPKIPFSTINPNLPWFKTNKHVQVSSQPTMIQIRTPIEKPTSFAQQTKNQNNGDFQIKQSCSTQSILMYFLINLS